MNTMLAGRFRLDSRTFGVEEVLVPVPGRGEVLVEVKAAGVCLSDVHVIDGTLSPFRPVEAVTGPPRAVRGDLGRGWPGRTRRPHRPPGRGSTGDRRRSVAVGPGARPHLRRRPCARPRRSRLHRGGGQGDPGKGLDAAFDFAGYPAVREQASAVLGFGGVLVLAGLTPAPITIGDSIGFSARTNEIRGHFGSEEQHLDELIGLTTTGRLDLAPSVTARVPLADAADAVAQLEKKIGDPIRIVLVP
jgi:threonine dehydrogenase-like Zn-dependent dehydrogenase